MGQARRYNRPVHDVIVTIVHGTWARGFLRPTVFRPEAPRWFEPGGRFYVDLEKSLRAEGFDPTLHSYTWSGDNSLVERNDAERGLVEHVRGLSVERPGVPQVLIGHSHGGSVAFRTAGALGPSAGDLFVATLATPFLDVREQQVSRVYQLGLWLLLSLSIGLPVSKFMKAGFAEWVDQKTANIYGAIVVGWLCYRGMKLLISSPRWQRLIDKTCRPFEVQCPVLVLRARLDEAALAIRVGNAAQAIGTFLRRFCTFLVFAMSMAFVGLGVYVSVVDRAQALAVLMMAFLPVVVLESWRATLVTAAISLLAVVALKGVNGSELAVCIASVWARVDGTPRGASKVEIAVLPKVGWLAHSLHENPLAATRIATWLASAVRPDRQ